jgi:hypothetical protein
MASGVECCSEAAVLSIIGVWSKPLGSLMWHQSHGVDGINTGAIHQLPQLEIEPAQQLAKVQCIWGLAFACQIFTAASGTYDITETNALSLS